MALIKCPECGKEISDLAKICVHCGYPLKAPANPDAAETAEAPAEATAETAAETVTETTEETKEESQSGIAIWLHDLVSKFGKTPLEVWIRSDSPAQRPS